MNFLKSDYQGFIIGSIPKMPKFTYLIFDYSFIDCLNMKIRKNHQIHEFRHSQA